MKKMTMRLMAMFLVITMLCGLIPAYASAAKAEAEPQELSQQGLATVNADIWSKIDSYEKENIKVTRAKAPEASDFVALTEGIISLVKASETYVEGSLFHNGENFYWETTVGGPQGYLPGLRAKTFGNSETGSDVTEVVSYAKKGGSPSSTDVYLIAPYYGYDSSFTDQYKNEASSIASATGGSYVKYEGTNATITNIGTAFEKGGVVIFDSHGITDYSSGDDYVSQANTSYLCLKTSTGITSTDTAAVSGTYGTYYHAFNGGSAYCVDGTAISNHMDSSAPGTIVWMAICLGMATNGLCTPLRSAGCEVVYGYSQSVSFTGDYKYETYFWDKMKAGSTVATAISYMKSAAGCSWDPAYSSYSLSSAKSNYVAFPIVVSDEDSYPGQGKVDAVQTVYSTYTLIGSSSSGSSSSGSSSSGSSDSGSSSSGSTSTSGDTYELITSASSLTAGDYIIIAAADGTYAGDYSYYALSTSKDGSYAAMSAVGLSYDSLPTALTCDSSSASSFVWTMTGSRTSFTLKSGSNYLISASGSTKLTLSTSSTSWSGSYSSTYKGFRLTGNSRYLSLRDDISTTGDNGNPLFCTVSSSSSGTTYLHFYKLSDSSSSGSSSGSTTSCSHSSTSTSTTDATCTSTGKTTVTCNSCGTVVSTTTIAALGHSYKYTSNGNGTHKITCSRCSYSSSASCSYSSNTCSYCGYSSSSSSGSTSSSALTSGQYVIAAKVGSTYYAMSNTFASKISGTAITVTNGTVSASDAEGYVVNITASGSYYTIDNGSTYLKYSSSTNFASSSSAYNWSIGTGTNGSYRITASTSTTRGIIFYRYYTRFGAYAVSNATSTSSYYYDVELLPVSGSSSSGSSSSGSSSSGSSSSSSSDSYTYELVTSSSGLTAGDYIIIAEATGTYAGDYDYYVMSTSQDGSYAAMSSTGQSFSSLPTSLTCTASAASSFEWTMTGSRTSFTLKASGGYLAGASGSTKLVLSTSATTWAGTYSSSYQGFRVKGNSRYISLRDDISTTGDNSNPLFCTVSSTSSGETYLHFYKCTTSKANTESTATAELPIISKTAKTTASCIYAKFAVDAAAASEFDRVYAIVTLDGKTTTIEAIDGEFTYTLSLRDKKDTLSIAIYAELGGITYACGTDTWTLADAESAR